MKVLLWAAIVLIVVFWLLSRNKGQRPASSQHRQARDSAAEPMLRCAHCGVHVPQSEAVAGTAGSVYCSEEHRRLH